MYDEAQTADLVLVMGTSLGGLYADTVATTCAREALSGCWAEGALPKLGSERAFGSLMSRSIATSAHVILRDLNMWPLAAFVGRPRRHA